MKPCPFCGSVAEIVDNGATGIDQTLLIRVACKQCRAATGPWWPVHSWQQGLGTFEHRADSEKKAVEAWNRRHVFELLKGGWEERHRLAAVRALDEISQEVGASWESSTAEKYLAELLANWERLGRAGVRLVVAIMTLCFAGAAQAESWNGPAADTLGARIQAWSYVGGPPVRPPGMALVYGITATRPDLRWLSFAVFHDSVLALRDAVPVLYCRGVRLEPAMAFAVGPPPVMAPAILARMDPGTLWRPRFRRSGATCSVVFAGYHQGAWSPDSCERVRMEKRDATR